MATSVFKPAVNGDDSTWINNGQFGQAGDALLFGAVVGYQYFNFIRFPNVTIPQGAIIRSAKLSFVADGSLSGAECNANIYCVDADNPIAPTTYAACEALTLTSSYSSWDGVEGFVKDSVYDSPSIKTIIQNIIDRSGWDDGNALIVVVKNNASTDGAYRSYYSYDNNPSMCPTLTIEYLGVTAAPFIITSSLSAYNIDTPDSLGYAYEESTGGSAMDVAVKTGEGVGKNILQQKQMKYLYYDLNTHGKDVTVTVYIDGVAQTDKTITLNTTTRERGRYEDIPDTWQGYRFSLAISCDDLTDDDLEIYAPFAIQYTAFGV